MIKKIFFMFLIFPAFGLPSDKKPERKCGKSDTLLAGPSEILKGDVKFLFENFDGTGKLQWESNEPTPFDLKLDKSSCLEYLYPYLVHENLFVLVKILEGKNMHFKSMFLAKMLKTSGQVVWKVDLRKFGINPSEPTKFYLKDGVIKIQWNEKKSKG